MYVCKAHRLLITLWGRGLQGGQSAHSFQAFHTPPPVLRHIESEACWQRGPIAGQVQKFGVHYLGRNQGQVLCWDDLVSVDILHSTCHLSSGSSARWCSGRCISVEKRSTYVLGYETLSPHFSGAPLCASSCSDL